MLFLKDPQSHLLLRIKVKLISERKRENEGYHNTLRVGGGGGVDGSDYVHCS